MSDPIDDLKCLCDGELPVNPLPASEVRRLGDRLRRRRVALQSIGAAAAVAVIATGGVLVDNGLNNSAPQVGTAEGGHAVTTHPVLDTDGYGRVQLAMTADEAVATGEMTVGSTPRNATCAQGRLNDGGLVDISKKHGVAAIWLAKQMKTPEGIHLGSTKKQVMAAYSDGHYDFQRYWTVRVSQTAEYQIAMQHGVVEELLLTTLNQDCFG